ncbi:MAG TPA: DUF5615 family PIN-like protein [Cytophagaceae bacterium]|jgi:predicted nuclease of predicted toxin-antitoxin system
MTIIIDAQLSPHLAPWIEATFQVKSVSVSFLGLNQSPDFEIFKLAKEMKAIVMTKDEDFVQLFHRLGSPPKLIWVTCGNTTNSRMKKILMDRLHQALDLLSNQDLVEISD